MMLLAGWGRLSSSSTFRKSKLSELASRSGRFRVGTAWMSAWTRTDSSSPARPEVVADCETDWFDQATLPETGPWKLMLFVVVLPEVLFGIAVPILLRW